MSVERSRIIVCDDQRDTAITLAQLLRLHGYEVFVCFDGPACLEKAQAWMPYAAIIDIGLPSITGYDVAQGLRALPGGEKIVLLAVTAYGNDVDIIDARLAGFNWHFKKPAPPTSVLSALRHPDVTTNFGTRL
jgi:CheY-like chemotaxis protein